MVYSPSLVSHWSVFCCMGCSFPRGHSWVMTAWCRANLGSIMACKSLEWGNRDEALSGYIYMRLFGGIRAGQAPRATDKKLTKYKRQVKSRESDCGALGILSVSLRLNSDSQFSFLWSRSFVMLTAENESQGLSLKPGTSNILDKHKLILLLKSLILEMRIVMGQR